MTEQQEALATAKGLTDVLTTVAGEVKGLRKSVRRGWKFILFDITVTIALAIVGFVSVHAVQSARNAEADAAAARAVARVAQQNNRNLCLSTNAARAQQVDLWNYVINVSPQPTTAEGKARTAAFEQHLKVIFQPRNCSHPSPGNPGSPPPAAKKGAH